jgi:hypothetical protein
MTQNIEKVALCFEQGCKADARRLSRKPVSFDSTIAAITLR